MRRGGGEEEERSGEKREIRRCRERDEGGAEGKN